MSKRSTYRSEQEDFEKYFGDELSDKERHDLERRALADAFESEAMDGWGEVPIATAQTDLTDLRERLQPVKRKSFNWLKIAAAIALLLVASIVVLTNINEQPEMLAQDSKTEEAPVQATESDKIQPTAPIEEEQRPEPVSLESNTIEETEEVTDTPVEDGFLASTNSNELEETFVDQTRVSAPVIQSISKVSDENTVVALDVTEMDIVESNTEVPVQVLAAEGLDQRAVELREESTGYEVTASDLFEVKSKADWSFRQIQGNVMDENGEIVSDARIVLNGTPILAVSDFNGKFEMAIPDSLSTPTLTFSSAGFNQLNYEINALDTFDVIMAHDDQHGFTNSLLYSPAATSRSANRSADEFDIETDDKQYSIFAEPVGGFKKFGKYVKKNTRKPEEAKQNGIQGTVLLSVQIDTLGNVIQVKVLRGLGSGCDEEAIRVVREGPKWIPAKSGDNPIESRVELGIKFD